MHPNPILRRRHSDELKSKVLIACNEPGASISGVALAHGLNTNLVRKWRSGHGVKRVGMAVTPTTRTPPTALATTAAFVAVEMPTPTPTPPKAAAYAAVQPTTASPIADPLIQIELRRNALHLSVRWPTTAAEDCRAWLSELSSGMLK
jgi:transposase